jgi:hypothetical protein
LYVASYTTTPGDSKALYKFSIAVFIFASFFWVWALLNTIRTNFDFGVVSFLAVMCTSSYGIRLTAAQGEASPSLLAKSLTIGSHILVALNYLLGSVLGFFELERPGFGVYCAVFVVLWLGIAYRAFVLMKQRSTMEDVERQ